MPGESICCFIHSECTVYSYLCSESGLGSHSCQSLCRLLKPGSLFFLPFSPFAPYSPSSTVTNSRQGWTAFLPCPQLHGHQWSWGKNSSPWGLKKVEVFQLRQKSPLSHPMWLRFSLFSVKLHLIWDRNSRAIGKKGCIFDYDFWVVLNSY